MAPFRLGYVTAELGVPVRRLNGALVMQLAPFVMLIQPVLLEMGSVSEDADLVDSVFMMRAPAELRSGVERVTGLNSMTVIPPTVRRADGSVEGVMLHPLFSAN